VAVGMFFGRVMCVADILGRGSRKKGPSDFLVRKVSSVEGETLLEKRFIRTSEIYFLYRLISVIDTINKK
jgi:hypothetical protein